MDTDLLRLLASKAMTVNKVDKSKKHWSKQNGVSVSASTDVRWVEDRVKYSVPVTVNFLNEYLLHSNLLNFGKMDTT